MNFFEHQEQARNLSSKLMVLFALAVLAITLSIWALCLVLLNYQGMQISLLSQGGLEVLQVVALLTISTITLGSLFKYMQLRMGGGHAVAQAMGGHAIDPGTKDPVERRLLNVVEEMAIASGIPVPTVYLLEEDGINAFAAGYRIEDAVVGITRGCMERLSRDQVQGIIAHEFSHILNGDMAINIRIMGVIFGILMISTIGRFLVYSRSHSRSRMMGKRDDKSGGIVVFGLVLIFVGWIGVFFGNIIKAAISRQREFLADASAVQFTRNPDGISGALKAIAAHAGGSTLESPGAEESSHMFFGSLGSSMTSLFATHPPLRERISRIDPAWDGNFGPPPEKKNLDRDKKTSKPVSEKKAGIDSLIANVGNPGVMQLAFAAALMQSIPNNLKESLRSSFGARAYCYGILLGKDKEIRKKQIEHLKNKADEEVVTELLTLLPAINDLKIEHRFPLINVGVPALQNLSPQQYDVFSENIIALINADNEVDLFEWSMEQFLLHHVGSKFKRPKIESIGNQHIDTLTEKCSNLMSAMIHFGVKQDFQKHAWEKVQSELSAKINPISWSGQWRLLEEAITALKALNPVEKQRLLKACIASMYVDKQLPHEAVELLRVVSALLGCPLPPMGT
ncbi:MAG: Zn-dependent protease with chaperone function [Chlamydiales bacterium]|jgi:Zn-dependent protease with chaperone function